LTSVVYADYTVTVFTLKRAKDMAENKKEYSSPKVEALGQHADLVATGGTTGGVDNTFIEDGTKFQSFSS